MDRETKMTTNGRARPSEPNVASSFAGLTHDVIELAELQAQLFAVDVKQTSQSTRSALVLAMVGACVLLGSIPVALIALAELLVQQLSWSPAASYGVATLVGVVISAAILGTAWAQFRAGLGNLSRSREELNRNIAWIKSNLRNRAQAHPAASD